MIGIDLHHGFKKAPGLKQCSEEHDKLSARHTALQDEVMVGLHRLKELDQGPRDSCWNKGFVYCQSKGGRVTESGSYYYREVSDGPAYRDRDGSWCTPTRQVLDNLVYHRSEVGRSGKPLRNITLSLAGGENSLLSKTLHDRHGKSIIAGGEGRRNLDIHYFPGDRIDRQA